MPSLKDKLLQLGLDLNNAPASAYGAYVPAKRVGNLVYVSGQLPMKDGKLLANGPVPSKCSEEHAKLAARQCVLNAMVAINGLDGSLDRIKGAVRVGAFIASDTDFTRQPAIANGASELLIELFGDSGKHVRAAVGTNVLPLGASVEIEFIFESD